MPDKWTEFMTCMIALIITVIVLIVSFTSDFEPEIKYGSVITAAVACVFYFTEYIKELKWRMRKQETDLTDGGDQDGDR